MSSWWYSLWSRIRLHTLLNIVQFKLLSNLYYFYQRSIWNYNRSCKFVWVIASASIVLTTWLGLNIFKRKLTRYKAARASFDGLWASIMSTSSKVKSKIKSPNILWSYNAFTKFENISKKRRELGSCKSKSMLMRVWVSRFLIKSVLIGNEKCSSR